jgi:hypothetical protein
MGKGRLAILYFAYRPEKEAIRKPLLPEFGHKVNTRIYQLLQSRASDIMSPTGLPILRIDDTKQVGDSFAERMCNAIESAHAQGFDKLIIMGNDAYSMRASHVHSAMDAMKKGNSCMIPSELGGSLLIGISKNQYTREQWLDLPWCTDVLFNELFDCLASCKILTEAMPELNSKTDVHELLFQKGELTHLAVFLLAILETDLSISSFIPPFQEDSLNDGVPFRGPPYMA